MRSLSIFLSFIVLMACSKEAKIQKVFIPSDIGVKLPFQEAEKNKQLLQQRLQSSPYANFTKKIASENKNAYIPQAKGVLPKADKAHLKVLNHAVDYVGQGLMTAADNFSLKQASVKIPMKGYIYSSAPAIKVLFLEEGKKLLKDKKNLSLPLLISSVYLYRADKVCIANLEGICRKELPEALSESLEQLEKKRAPSFTLFQTLSSEVLDSLSSEETLSIEYRRLSNAEFSKNASTKGVHPAENPFIEELTDYAFAHYHSKFKNNPKASMEDFINKFQIADCDMTALSQILKLKSSTEQGFLLFSMYGNMPIKTKENNTVIDIDTANHAWNLSTRENQMWSIDFTPYPISNGFIYTFNKELLEAAKTKIDRIDSFEKFNAWELFSPIEVESGSHLLDQKSLYEEFEKEKLKFLQGVVSSDYTLIPDRNLPNSNMYKNIKQGQSLFLLSSPKFQIQFSIGQLLLQEPRNREDSPWQSSTFVNFESTNKKFVGLNVAQFPKEKKFKFQILSISNEGLSGHDFSDITKDQINRNLEAYKKTFNCAPLTKDPLLDIGSGQIASSYYGKYPTSEDLIDFWRNRGCRVNPVFSSTIEYAVSLE